MFGSRNNETNSTTSQTSCKRDIYDKKKVKSRDDDIQQFLSYFQQSNIPQPDQWPQDSPVFVTASKRAEHITYCLPTEEDGIGMTSFPMNGEPIHFNGPLFQGTIISRMRDVPSMSKKCCSGTAKGDDYFKGRSRQFQWSVSGTFTKRMRFDQVVTGQDFGRPFRNAPATNLVKRGLDLLKNKLPETFECDLLSEEPRFEHPLIAGCQSFRVDRLDLFQKISDRVPYEEILEKEIVEDTSLLDDPSIPKESDARRKFFSKKENLENYFFETGFIYTFDFYANFFSPARHRLELTPFFSIDLAPYFNGYPLFMAMAKEKENGDYLWATEMWHKRLLNYDEKLGIVGRLFASKNRKK